MTGTIRLIRSPISAAGMVLTTVSAVSFLVVFFADLFGLHTNPHLGIVFFLVLPGLFLIGLLLIPLGASLGREKYTALQASRTANPLTANTVAFLNDPSQQFNDPCRDWTDDSADTVRTVTASMDLIKLLPKIDVKLAYDYSRAESTYTYGLAANTVIAAPLQLTPVVNELQRGTIDARYFVSRRAAVGVVYWFDRYRVDDFALGPVASLAQPATAAPTLLLLGYFYRPYTANSVRLRFTYFW